MSVITYLTFGVNFPRLKENQVKRVLEYVSAKIKESRGNLIERVKVELHRKFILNLQAMQKVPRKKKR